MPNATHSQPKLIIDFFIIIIAAALLVLASLSGLQAGHPATKGAGAVYGGVYIIYLGVLFLLSHFFSQACYVFIFLQFICNSFSSPRGRNMAPIYFALFFGLGLYLLLTGMGFAL